MVALETISSFAFLYMVVQLTGAALSLHAIMTIKRTQSAVAWSLSLIGIPLITIPAYLLFGQGHFYGYVKTRQETLKKLEFNPPDSHHQKSCLLPDKLNPHNARTLNQLEKITNAVFSGGNNAQLLIDGEETFAAMQAAIERAQSYILVQFYIVRDDNLGQRFKDLLLKKASEGVAIYFLYDEMGCLSLSSSYLDQLEEGGIKVCSFNSTRGPKNLLHMNFRNHRKILVVDGSVGFVGGHNLGDEYLGHSRKYGFWRDTHLRLAGPALRTLQQAFIEDWYWGAGSIPDVIWNGNNKPQEGQATLVAPTGPADPLDTAVLTVLEIIGSANNRLWIVSPYFVPELAIMRALQAAALRGVDVRIMLPEKADKLLVWLASYTFFDEVLKAGVKLYSYQKGFLHQKVILVDDYLATVGTANLDNRSLSLNFEITVVVADKKFASAVEAMLRDDFENCRELHQKDIENKPFYFSLGARLARLFSPLL